MSEYGRVRATVDLLSAYSFWIGLAAFLAVAGTALAVVLGVVAVPSVSVPRSGKVFLVGSLAAVAIGYAPALRVVDWLYKPDGVYLVDVDARDDQFALYRLSPEKWEDLYVEEGELYRLQASREAYECRSYDPDANRCRATWRGSASDMELLEERERIDEIRTTLEERARDGLTLRMRLGDIVRTSVEGFLTDLVTDAEQADLQYGDEIEKAVSNALDNHDVQAESERERYRQNEPDNMTDPEPTQNGTDAVADGGDR